MRESDKNSGNPKIWKKKPRQDRSKNTVNCILEAARKIFSEYGFQETKSEDIAKRAGVGVASLYDYFPNKTAIATALVETVTFDIIDDVRNIFLVNTYESDSFRTGLPIVVERIYENYKNNKDVLIVLISEVPDLKNSHLYSIERLIHQASQIFLRMYWDEIPINNLHKAHAFINLVFTASIKEYISTRTPELNEDEFLKEITELILTYLTQPQGSIE
ncbi:TetR/AcrR family transcriptional regulator [Halioxenophilus aromaticivorans]|uniref:TetR/AcrR family transcriptional regulator n=1 Tax=Halioxenophilus aromaticivorans TaxID=1306992 RepID=A0AAV3TX26_9ALTE